MAKPYYINIKQLSAKYTFIYLIVVVLVAIIFGGIIPYSIQATFYTISLIIKELLLYLLPLIIFSLIFNSVCKLGSQAIKITALIVPAILISGWIATWFGYTITNMHGKLISSHLPEISLSQSLPPLYKIHLSPLISNDLALISGFICGIIACLSNLPILQKTSYQLNQTANFILKKIFIPIMPIFIFGYLLEFQYNNSLSIILTKYIPTLIIIVSSQIIYISTIYGIAVKFKLVTWKKTMISMLPAAIAGFSSMSSAAALPLTLTGVSNNIKNKQLAELLTTATVNIHLIGDCIAIPILAIGILQTFGLNTPSISEYSTFVIYFLLAKFAVASVPAGGILVMLPILEQQLSFNSNMLSLITILYMMFDIFITPANIMGNGAFAVVFNKVCNRRSILSQKAITS